MMLLKLCLHLGIVLQPLHLALRQLNRGHFERVHIPQASVIDFMKLIAARIPVHWFLSSSVVVGRYSIRSIKQPKAAYELVAPSVVKLSYRIARPHEHVGMRASALDAT
jgi:hypothetical protein